MCPLWPFHTIILYFIMLLPLCLMSFKVVQASAAKWNVQFKPSKAFDMNMYDVKVIKVMSSDLSLDDYNNGVAYLQSSEPDIAEFFDPPQKVMLNTKRLSDGTFNFTSFFNISANFLGYTEVKAVLVNNLSNGTTVTRESDTIRVNVLKNDRFVDKVFLVSVIGLVSIIYINFGCAIEWEVMKKVLRRPIGPSIGILCHFFVMPIISFVLGQLLFTDSTALQLGLFFTGIAPAGGASNIWTCTLGGNLNLSVTMTAVSTFFAFIMMPLWVFTLGRVIFSNGNLAVPYGPIARSAITLVIPLAIGAALQVYCPRFSKFMVRILKPFSGLLLIFIILFATLTNLYLFKLFTWKIALAGLGLPFCGYLIGGLIARLCKQVPEDVLAISIETGIQNTGVAIFMLQYSLGQPEADLTTVAPVSVAMMTPVPLTLLYFYLKCCSKSIKTSKNSLSQPFTNSEENYQPYRSTNSNDSLNGHM